MSAADPVQRGSGRLVHLSDSPFLLGELDPAEVLAPQVEGPVIVDNDVNWAARAEREHGGAGRLDDFAYVFLGEGLGCAIVSDGEVSRGHAGLAGEIAHLITVGPHGQATRLIEVFGELRLRQAGSTAIDAGRLLSVVAGQDARGGGHAARPGPGHQRGPRGHRRARGPRAGHHRRLLGPPPGGHAGHLVSLRRPPPAGARPGRRAHGPAIPGRGTKRRGQAAAVGHRGRRSPAARWLTVTRGSRGAGRRCRPGARPRPAGPAACRRRGSPPRSRCAGPRCGRCSAAAAGSRSAGH